MTHSGRARWGVIVTLVLVIGFAAASFWAGLMYRGWINPDVYGYVGIEPSRRFDPLHYNPNDGVTDWTGIEIEQRTQSTLLTSDTLLQSALSNSADLRGTGWFKSFKDPRDAKRWLVDHFCAEPVKDSKLIKVYVTGVRDRKDAKKIVEAVVNTYLDQQKSVATNKVLDRTAQLNSLRSKQEQRIHDLQERQNNLMLHLNLGQIGSAERFTAVDVEYTKAIENQVKLRTDLVTAEFRLAALKKQDRPADTIADAQLRVDELRAGYDAGKESIDKLKGQLGDLAISMSEYLSTSDELNATRMAYKEVKDQLETLGSQGAETIVSWKQQPEASDDQFPN